VQYYEQLYVLLVKLYESAKLDEARDSAVIQVVDKAVVPAKKAKPKRLLIIILSVFVGFFLSVVAAFVIDFKEKASAYPGNKERIESIGRYARWRNKE
jgi:tyrosine-protein kinase Etk/Wzc